MELCVTKLWFICMTSSQGHSFETLFFSSRTKNKFHMTANTRYNELVQIEMRTKKKFFEHVAQLEHGIKNKTINKTDAHLSMIQT